MGGGLDLASPSGAGAALARHRWSQNRADPMVAVTGIYPCGTSDEFGRCAEPYHSADCGSLATTEIAEALQESGAYADRAGEALADSSGRAWADQEGQPMNLTDHIEAATGQRLAGGSLFESGYGHRELVSPQRQARYGDPSDPDDPGTDLPDISALTAQLGLSDRSAAGERDRARSDPRAIIGALSRGISPDAQWDVSGRRRAGRGTAGRAPGRV